MTASPRIFLFHATPVAMEPIQTAMRRLWPQADSANILDESLSLDRQGGGPLPDALTERFLSLGRQALAGGADGILITCSAFGPAIRRMQSEFSIPVLMPNEAMFRAALTYGSRIGMLATFAPAVATMEEEFAAFAAETGSLAGLETRIAAGAIDSLRNGDAEDHNQRVAETARAFAGHDAVMLAHFSTSRAAFAVGQVIGVPVLTAPEAAVRHMRRQIEGE